MSDWAGEHLKETKRRPPDEEEEISAGGETYVVRRWKSSDHIYELDEADRPVRKDVQG